MKDLGNGLVAYTEKEWNKKHPPKLPAKEYFARQRSCKHRYRGEFIERTYARGAEFFLVVRRCSKCGHFEARAINPVDCDGEHVYPASGWGTDLRRYAWSLNTPPQLSNGKRGGE